MSRRFYRVTRDLHLYFGLFISPFILVFAVSVFFLVHPQSQNAAVGTKSLISNWYELPEKRRLGVIILSLGVLSCGLFCVGLRLFY
jgi:hypothetical protein